LSDRKLFCELDCPYGAFEYLEESTCYQINTNLLAVTCLLEL
jgi:hypothetical protein